MLLLAGCTKEDDLKDHTSSGEDKNLEDQILQLNHQLKESENQILELKNLYEQNANSTTEYYNELNTKIYMLENILYKLPNLEVRHSYINEMKLDGTNVELEVTLANMLDDEDAPNGYSIEEKEKRNILVDNEASFFVLEGTSMTQVPSVEELQPIIDRSKRFFKLYIVNDRILMLAEQYLP